jgi:transaldolase
MGGSELEPCVDGNPMDRLHRLYAEFGQSPWLDNLRREDLNTGHLAELVGQGIRGVTANPTIIARAMAASAAYDKQFGELVGSGLSVPEAYWRLVIDDVTAALTVLRHVYDDSGGADGFVSLELDPRLAADTTASVAAAAELHAQITAPNLLVKIPATRAGVEAITEATGAGQNINVTLIFSLERYAEVIEAYLSGLEAYASRGGDVSRVHSVASFFVSRIDTEVDRQLSSLDGPVASLLGTAAIAQAHLAYGQFKAAFRGGRWDALSQAGAHVQRPLWASTSTKNPAYSDTRYVDALIGPDTVNTMPEGTIVAFADHGTLHRTVDQDPAGAADALERLRDAGIDMQAVAARLEAEAVAAFTTSFEEALALLEAKARPPG